MNNDYEKTSAQKLAETLKRCGLASSVTQAHKMAGDITSTEKKVQSFFDQKKTEMKDDLMRNVHPNREEFQIKKEPTLFEKQAMQEVVKQMEKQTEEILAPVQMEVYHHDEPVIEAKSEEPKILVIKDDKHEEEIFSSQTPLNEMCQESGKNEGDFLDKYIQQEAKAEPVAEKEAKIEIIKEDMAPEPKVEAPKPALPPKPAYQSPVMGPHPKTGQGFPGVSLQDYFNYSKRAK